MASTAVVGPDRGVARDPDLRFRRTRYDHPAGQVGTPYRFADPRRAVEPKGPRDWKLTDRELFCQSWASTCRARRAGTRHFARQCLDWRSGGAHISGALGAAIAQTFFTRGWAERLRRSRTVRLTDSGRRAMGSHFGATI